MTRFDRYVSRMKKISESPSTLGYVNLLRAYLDQMKDIPWDRIADHTKQREAVLNSLRTMCNSEVNSGVLAEWLRVNIAKEALLGSSESVSQKEGKNTSNIDVEE